MAVLDQTRAIIQSPPKQLTSTNLCSVICSLQLGIQLFPLHLKANLGFSNRHLGPGTVSVTNVRAPLFQRLLACPAVLAGFSHLWKSMTILVFCLAIRHFSHALLVLECPSQLRKIPGHLFCANLVWNGIFVCVAPPFQLEIKVNFGRMPIFSVPTWYGMLFLVGWLLLSAF